jgi:hypothetical protein
MLAESEKEWRYSMKPTFDEIVNRLKNLENHFLFEFNGELCGIDPLSRKNYSFWYGSKNAAASSLEEVLTSPFWDGKTLASIYPQLDIIEW